MSTLKVRITVTTNTNIRFITALPATYSVSRALPLLL